ncbi:LacI family DNA-binding transcriptional regulator [Clostridium beijerinckii]|uniref:LacI family DNA-binding transcriptional regulator n=1 Tax=Clostridium beijerinckii TaxID=1520 RepID=UPI00098C953F|nr:LacI family DNA-binding transcriptional regulator [Clostridium beijerinckii]MDG5856187.1 LacI family DNA-binding transcriptional regulator [Clostridium beijerinckii]NRT79810.1 LacI family transcriptional regulator [Clostridium beijerinckii]OOM46885.1 catabolite control protein A [Clostridium beijerinckii]
MPATMKDVAKEAGVALGTVSKVINNIPVSEEYKIKVEEAIKKLGYEVDIYARGMKKQKTDTIALIIPNLFVPFFAHFAYYLEYELSKHNYKLLLCNSDGNAEKEVRYINMAKQNKVDGIVGITYSDIDKEISNNCKFVSIDRHFSNPDIPYVASDNYKGGTIAAQKLIDIGCKSVAFIRTGSNVYGETYKRKIGFIDACKENNINYKVLDLAEPFDNLEKACSEFLEENICNRKLLIDGIFFSTDLLALRVKKIIESYGFSIPNDVSIIGYDGIKIVPDLDYIVSSIHQPVDLMAKKCVEIIISLINKQTVPKVNYLPVDFVDGGTTK